MKGQENKQIKRKLSKAWPIFSTKLAAVLEGLHEDQILIISRKNHDQDAVQFVGQGSWGIRAEVISNFFRPDDDQLAETQIASLTSLGWNAPTGSDETSTPIADPDGSPNWHVDFPQPVDCTTIANLAVSALIQVFNISHPGWLQYESFDGEGNSISCAELGLKLQIASDSTENLRDKLLPLLCEITGLPNLHVDEEGDIAGIHYRNLTVYLRPLDDRPYMRCLTMLLSGVEESLPLLARINQLNLKNGLHLYSFNGWVAAVSDMCVAPLVSSHITYGLSNFCETADELYEVLNEEFGKAACHVNQPNHLTH